MSKSKQRELTDIEIDRINPDILKAFRENPYTFSLTNSV
jgi:hypothetical protein